MVVVQGNSILVMCETYAKDGTPHPTNKRYSCGRIMESSVPLEVTILRVATLLYVTKVARNFKCMTCACNMHDASIRNSSKFM